MPHGMAKKKERVYKPRVVDGKPSRHVVCQQRPWAADRRTRNEAKSSRRKCAQLRCSTHLAQGNTSQWANFDPADRAPLVEAPGETGWTPDDSPSRDETMPSWSPNASTRTAYPRDRCRALKDHPRPLSPWRPEDLTPQHCPDSKGQP